MRGFGTKPTGEPIQNPSWMNLPRADAPGWGINGPGVSAEWTQGGESEWNSAAASADETSGTIYQDIEIPRAGNYRIWVRYADWANRSENFVIRITQGVDRETGRHGDAESEDLPSRSPGIPASPRSPVSASPRPRVATSREVFRHEFGTKDVIDPHDETSMYWGWAFAWDGVNAQLQKGPARISIQIEKSAEARRHIDCTLLTNDLAYVPEGRRKPDFAAMGYLRKWSTSRTELSSLLPPPAASVSLVSLSAWQRPKIAGRDFVMPWNISTEFWKLYDKPAAERPLYPFNAEPIEQFVQKYKAARDVPLFSSKFVVPVIYINNLPEYLKEGSPFLRYLRETKIPFAILINYGSAVMSAEEGQAAWKLLSGELKDQFLGWMSGESVGYVWDQSPAQLKISASMSRRELLEAHRVFYTNAIAQKWAAIFHTETGAMWDKLIPAQSTSSTSFAHALTEWGVRQLGLETAAVQPMFAMRTAFTRGAARQYGGTFLYYHAPGFGDTSTAFTAQQNFAGPDNFFHSRYGATMGPSLSWYRKSYYFYYMSGASAIYLEQGFDQFFKPGPGEHAFQLNPLGRITDEFMRFAEKHSDRGTPYTPIAFLLDPAHGWDMTDYPQWPFEVSPINRSDRALRELFGVAYYPGLVVEGEPATGDRQAFVSGIFGDIFDVLVANEVQSPKSKVGLVRTGSGSARASKIQNPKSKVQSREGAKKRIATKSSDWEYEGSNSDRSSTPSPLPVTHSPVPPAPPYPLDAYRAIVVGGHLDWSPEWIQRLTAYVKSGGTVVLNSAQIKGVPAELLGLRLTGATAEARNAHCLSPGEATEDLSGQIFRYEKLELQGAQALITTITGDPLVTVNKLGKGAIVFSAVPDLLGEDERITPFAAHMLAHVFADATPIKVRGDVEYLVNRNENGWVITLINNNGVFKPQQGMAQVDRSAYVRASITLAGQQIQKATDWITEKDVAVKTVNGANGVTVTIAPGGISIVELQTRLK
ncbi:MAG TPA: hypothetical protein VGO73_12645 [Pyrinomonadaceae bacterium]|jgi:hypothetical protein|nr:hypothetical protein [Pyrinomonadaceae bacterium]